MLILSLKYTVCCDLTYLQKSRIQNMQFVVYISDTVKVIKTRATMLTRNKVIIMQSFKDLALMVSDKKPTLKFFSNKEVCQISPLNMCKNQK